jgi:hypothetical protein
MKKEFKREVVIAWVKIIATILIGAFICYLAISEDVFIIGL